MDIVLIYATDSAPEGYDFSSRRSSAYWGMRKLPTSERYLLLCPITGAVLDRRGCTTTAPRVSGHPSLYQARRTSGHGSAGPKAGDRHARGLQGLQPGEVNHKVTKDTVGQTDSEKITTGENADSDTKALGNFNNPRRIAAPLCTGRNFTVTLTRSQVSLAPRSMLRYCLPSTEPLGLLD